MNSLQAIIVSGRDAEMRFLSRKKTIFLIEKVREIRDVWFESHLENV